MTTKAADRNEPLRDNRIENTHPWLHRDCGHLQNVPTTGGIVQCEGCEGWIDLKPKKQLLEENKHIDKSAQMTLDGNIASANRKQKSPKIVLPFEMVTLKRRNQWDKLFEGFTSMKAISFVVQPVFLLEYFSKRGYDKIELLVGKGLTERYKEKLSDTKWQIIEELHEKTDSRELTLWGTKDEVHTKLYILENDEYVRVITGSPNLSYKASGAGQIEFVVYQDLFHDNPSHQIILEQYLNHYEKHFTDKCKKFMDDLSELFIDLNDMEPKEVIRIWKSNSHSSDIRSFRVIYDELSAEAMKETDDPEDDVITITFPKISQSHKTVLTGSLGAKFEGSDMTVSRKKFLNAESHLGVPHMKLNEETGCFKIGINGKLRTLNQTYTVDDLNEGLMDIERYISMVDTATCDAPEYVKMSMMESIIYAFAAPFANHWLRNKRLLTNYSNRRGPRHLLLIGDGFNGKTTFLRYINWLITSSHLEPVDAKKYTTKEWTNLFSHIQTSGSMMPVMIDDIKKRAVQGKTPALEPFIKSYFEGEWNDRLTYPMILGSSNYTVDGDWAKSRVRRLNFDVQFSGDESDEILINQLISKKNVVFSAFSSEYISRLAMGLEYNKDELFDARKVMEYLYSKVGREPPSYFPETLPEDHFDVDAIYCYSQVRSHKLVTEKMRNGVVILTFKGFSAMHEFRSRLPQTIKYQYNGEEMVIQNREIYEKFLAKGRTKNKKTLFSRFFR
jgi:hypothetical protein